MNITQFVDFMNKMRPNTDTKIKIKVRVSNCKLKCITDDDDKIYINDDLIFKIDCLGEISTRICVYKNKKYYIRQTFCDKYMLCDNTEHIISCSRKYEPVFTVLNNILLNHNVS